MALHGTIEVNRETIGEWEAVNRGPIANPPDDRTWCRYECRVAAEYRVWTGWVEHAREDGPVVLAALVLAAARV